MVGLSVMTFQRAHGVADRARWYARCARRPASSSAATIPASRPTPTSIAGRRLHRPRRRRAYAVASCCARSRHGRDASAHRRACRTATPDGSAQPGSRASRLWRRARCACRTAPRACSRGYTLLGRQVDVVETSRGCTYDCSFCSIIEMRGRNFHPYSDRSRAGRHRRRPAHGAEAIFLVDDNITLDVARFEALCQRDHRRRLRRHRLHRAGDDLAARAARRAAGAADAARRLPLRLPRHREHPRRAISCS